MTSNNAGNHVIKALISNSSIDIFITNPIKDNPNNAIEICFIKISLLIRSDRATKVAPPKILESGINRVNARLIAPL